MSGFIVALLTAQLQQFYDFAASESTSKYFRNKPKGHFCNVDKTTFTITNFIQPELGSKHVYIVLTKEADRQKCCF